MIFGAIFMMGANLFFSFQFRLSVITSGIMLAIFFVALYFFPANVYYQLAFGTFYISCFVFTSYVNWKLNKERYNVFLNALEARTQQREATERGKALLQTVANRSVDGPGESPGRRREAPGPLERLAKVRQQLCGDPRRRRLLQKIQ